MKRQRAEILSNVISHIKSAHPIEMWRSNKLGIKGKISRGKFPRLIFSCPVPSGLPHRSHCVPMNMNPGDHSAFGTPARARTGGLGLRRYVCRIACDVLTYTAVHFDHAAAIIHISYCAIQSTLGAFYNQSNR